LFLLLSDFFQVTKIDGAKKKKNQVLKITFFNCSANFLFLSSSALASSSILFFSAS
jgi:hypothetical protein